MLSERMKRDWPQQIKIGGARTKLLSVRYIIRADKNDMSDIFLIAEQTGAEW
jgi:hypothetical protein